MKLTFPYQENSDINACMFILQEQKYISKSKLDLQILPENLVSIPYDTKSFSVLISMKFRDEILSYLCESFSLKKSKCHIVIYNNNNKHTFEQTIAIGC